MNSTLQPIFVDDISTAKKIGMFCLFDEQQGMMRPYIFDATAHDYEGYGKSPTAKLLVDILNFCSKHNIFHYPHLNQLGYEKVHQENYLVLDGGWCISDAELDMIPRPTIYDIEQKEDFEALKKLEIL